MLTLFKAYTRICGFVSDRVCSTTMPVTALDYVHKWSFPSVQSVHNSRNGNDIKLLLTIKMLIA